MIARALALALLAASIAACDELGNPDPAPLRTAAVTWSSGPYALETRTVSAPPSRSDELARAIAPARFDHVDTSAPTGGVVTLVVVTPRFGAPPPERTIPLVTELRLRDGSTVTREWSARSLAPAYYAGFGLPSAPVAAVTRIGR